MAYYTGKINNYPELLTALVTHCQGHGWSWSGGILSKNTAFVKVTEATNVVDGIHIQGGTGQLGSELLEPSQAKPRLGWPGTGREVMPEATWPATYHLHIFDDPDEVFLVMEFSTLYHYWLAFGVSEVSLPGTGLWLNAMIYQGRCNSGFSVQFGASDNSLSGGNTYANLFLSTRYSRNLESSPSTIHINIGGDSWATNGSAFFAIDYCAPHLERSPNAWNQESILIPIHGYILRPENKRSFVLNVKNARYIRVDNFEPGDIITLGTDQWKVYPFYLKNTDERDGGINITHTGTFGWALRAN